MPFQYSEPVYRPPSEARSLILQPTIGCSWNRCSFCEMYTSKKFKVKSEEELFNEIDEVGKITKEIRKVFLADGNAMVLSFSKLLNILEKLNSVFPKLIRVSAYALPTDIEAKSELELEKLNKAGLKLLYTGIESGDNTVLKLMNKGETDDSIVTQLNKARNSGIKLSVMILNGLGGKEHSSQHMLNSARVVNAINPEFLSTLVLSFTYGIEHFQNRLNHAFTPLSKLELIEELAVFIKNLELENTVFRSDHASNYLTLKGILNRDKENLLDKIRTVTNNYNENMLKPEWLRGL